MSISNRRAQKCRLVLPNRRAAGYSCKCNFSYYLYVWVSSSSVDISKISTLSCGHYIISSLAIFRNCGQCDALGYFLWPFSESNTFSNTISLPTHFSKEELHANGTSITQVDWLSRQCKQLTLLENGSLVAAALLPWWPGHAWNRRLCRRAPTC
jgi:hypothetical protein